MSKFNTNVQGSNTTVNKAGGKAFKINDAHTDLAIKVMTSFMKEPKYYGDNSSDIIMTIRKVLENDAQFIANLALYARKELHMRSISHVLVAELAHHENGKKYVREVINNVVERTDDLTEILSYYLATFGKPIPNSIKKGIADMLLQQSEYSLAKYNRDSSVKLKDLVMLTHPSPKNKEQEELMGKLLNDNLEIPITWETQLSVQDGRTKKEKWNSLIENRNLGYFATLRNMRNIINECDTKHVDMMLDYISNEKAVRNNKMLPFRYFSAYKELQNGLFTSSKSLDALETAMDYSIDNMPKLSGKTFLTADVSGSMDNPLSKNSTVTYKDVSTLMMAMGQKICDEAITSVFGSNFQVTNVSTKSGIIGNKQMFDKINVGYSTNFYKVLEYLIQNKVFVDRIIVFSDMQCYDDRYSWGNASTMPQKLIEQYKKEVNPNVFVHSVDLAGYGTTQFIPSKKVNLIAGWSEKILNYISLTENGTTTLVKDIKNYHFN